MPDYNKKRSGGVRRKGRYNGFWLFLLSMIISFCILGCLFLGLLYYTRTNGVLEPQEDIPYISEYHPSKDENMTVLLMGCETPESPPELFVLFKYDAPRGRLRCITFPSALICKTSQGREDTLAGQYDYSGIGGAVDALGKLLDIEIDRYMRVQRLGLSNIVDFFGGVPYNLTTPREIGEETLLAGEQLLDGRRLSALCFADASEKAPLPDCGLQAELTSLLIKSGFSEFSPTKYSALSNSVFYNSETNITQYDFALRQEGFLNSIKKESLEIGEYSLKGLYSSDYSAFYPNMQSLKEVKEFLL